jgi:hypothetical protein
VAGAAGRPARPSGGLALLLPAVAGVALIAAMFALDWFGPGETVARGFEEAREIQEQFGGPEVMIPDVSENAWDALGLVKLVLVAAGLCGVALTLVRMIADPPVSRLGMAALATGAGTLATAIVLYHLVNPPADASREIGVFVGLVAAGGVAVGGWIALEEEETRVNPPSARRGRGRSARRTRSRSSSG